ncbi:hypothetical protein F4678DRAFT_483639 [Xylaria arbuscula]|nr:hypothetical protein F4678DRAFT_483639 [Xylaria arbuscula]
MTKAKFEVHLFGGQGWPGLFEDQAISVAKHDARASPYAEELLRRSHTGLVKDLTAHFSDNTEYLCEVLAAFSSPISLLCPPISIQHQPWVQWTTLCLFQLLRFLAKSLAISSFHEAIDRIRGSAGFCSGILPATVVASSPTINDFISNGVQAVRAAFWIGYRAAEYSQNLLADGNSIIDGPWTYNLSGISQEQIFQLLSQFNSQFQSSHNLQLGAILNTNSFNVCGPCSSFEFFLPQLPESCTIRPVGVNALYHAGTRLDSLVSIISQDFRDNKVFLPSFESLGCFVYSPVDGSKLSATESPSTTSLPQYILETILVKPVNWASVISSLKLDRSIEVTVVYGPAANLLMPSSVASPQHELKKQDVSHDNLDVQLHANYERKEDDIAIIGFGFDFPNGSSVHDFWQSLEEGASFVRQAPEDRFAHEELGRNSTFRTPHHGNFVPDLWGFDNSLFNVSPREAKSMDPQQRTLLQCSLHALQHAGYAPDSTKSFQRRSFGCYIGVATGDYAERSSQDIDVYYSPGTLRAFLSGRISYYFGLSGPSVVIDTACSGSLVAIHQACRALIARDCNTALAGGVNAICGPNMQTGLARARFLSMNGQCRPFDTAADGYCRSEGGAMFVLKRLTDAIAENDRVLGVIKATGVNQSGNADSITHPDARTQVDLFQTTLARQSLLSQSITAVEAHGTGTQAGDPVEFESISTFFGRRRISSNPLIVSSIKGNIGHAEAASGAAGLLKLLLMIAKGRAPPQAGLEKLNPKISALMSDSTVIPRHLIDWPRLRGMPRRALLNNFGAAGSNACLVLEEYIAHGGEEHAYRDSSQQNSAYLVVLSAKDNVSLERYRQLVLQDTNLRKMPLCDISYTSTARRTILESRLVFTASSTKDLFQSIEAHSYAPPPTTLSQRRSPPRVLFVFSGQGSQYVGMGRELLNTVPKFREDVLSCDNVLKKHGYNSFMSLLESDPVATKHAGDYGMLANHCATFAIEYALTRLYISWGIRPSALIGHSLGEFAAFVAANVLGMEDAILIVAHRATILEETCELGVTTMLSIATHKNDVMNFLSGAESLFPSVTVACDNSPQQCVVSGPLEEIDKLAKLMQTAHIRTKKLDVSIGYHSSAIEPIRMPLITALSNVPLRQPETPVGLGLHGRMHRPNDIDHGYFCSQAIGRVRFREVVEDFLSSDGESPTICLEIGPHNVVLPMMKALLPSPSTTLVSSLRRGTEAWSAVCDSLKQFVRYGFDVGFRRVFEGSDVRMVDMPLYPFAKEQFIIPHQSPIRHEISSALSSSEEQAQMGFFLDSKLPEAPSHDGRVVYEANHNLDKFISGHRVAGRPICPASVYIEVALQAANDLRPRRTRNEIAVREMTFPSPLMQQDEYSPSNSPVQVLLIPGSEESNEITFHVSSETNGIHQKHCRGLLQHPEDSRVDMQDNKGILGITRHHGQLIRRKMIYELVFSRVVSYSDLYQTIDYLELSDDSRSAWGSFRLRPCALVSEGISQPVFVDTLLHAAGFLANLFVKSAEICICVAIDIVQLPREETIDYAEAFSLYTEISVTHQTIVGNTFVFDGEGTPIGSVQGIVFRRLDHAKFTKSLEVVRTTGDSTLNKTYNSFLPKGNIESPYRLSPILNNVTMDVIRDRGFVDRHREEAIPEGPLFTAIAGVFRLPRDKIHGETDLKYLGLDSLMTFELLDLLKESFGIEIAHNELESCHTPNDLIRLINPDRPVIAEPNRHQNEYNSDHKDTSYANRGVGQLLIAKTNGHSDGLEKVPKASSNCLSLISKGSDDAMPIYFIHDGSGLCSMYSNLGLLDHSVFGISSDPRTKFRSIEDMAAAYAALINRQKPFILGGWSFGGVVAHQMARILHRQNAKLVKGVILIDSPCPTTHDGIPSTVLRRIFGAKPERVLHNFEAHSSLLGAFQPASAVGSECPVILIQSREPVSSDVLGGDPCPFLEDGPERERQASLWRKFVGPQLHVLGIPGNHFEAFTDFVITETTRAMLQAIAIIKRSN